MASTVLTLEVAEYQDPQHWYWKLKDTNEKPIGDKEVSLDPTDHEFQGWLDLYGYLRVNASPDNRLEDESRLVGQVGHWIGEQVFGDLGRKIIEAGTPSVVRVIVPGQPEAAAGLLYRPLELGHVNGRPLAMQDVSLVFEIGDESPNISLEPVQHKLRMLAVFSLPTSASALNLRRERYELKRLIQGIASRAGLAIELRVLQYGVTREALGRIFQEGEGWDIVHFSGHGLEANLILEQADGSEDRVPSTELVELLRPARGRIKWVTLSACLSAAATIEETLRWLGLEPRREGETGEAAEPEAAEAEPELPAVARALIRELDCAVLAMRYPVGDEFAIDLGQELYGNVIERKHPLTRAVQLALAETASGPGRMPLSVATPALFGRRAAEIEVSVPKAPITFSTAPAGLAHFPPEPEVFVGRVGVLTRASQALAPDRGRTGVLFHGMAGAGKTFCALEMAYQHHEVARFTGFVWFKAPDPDQDISGAMYDFARAMETQLPGFTMAHLADRPDELYRWLPELTELLGRSSILIVLDNLESLLRTNGPWRDERWGKLIEALLAHRGQSRTILTSRIRPEVPHPGGEGNVLLELPIHALTLAESALLARQLPNLGRLLRGEAAATGQERETHRQLVSRALNVVQGHPKLIELAEGQAAEPESLERHLDRATEAWAGGTGRLAAFFETGESALNAVDFLAALAAWTQSIASTLTPQAQALFHALCCMEEGDRQSGVLGPIWPNLWKRLGLEGDAPAPETALNLLAEAGLVDVTAPRAAGPGDEEAEREARNYRVHPGVAEAGRAEAGEDFRSAVDAELAAFWTAVFRHGLKEEARGGGHLVLQGGRRAAPYLMRLERWDEASTLLEWVIRRDPSPPTIASVLPLLRRIAEATKDSERELIDAGVLASALLEAGRWEEAERMETDRIKRCCQEGNYRLASVATSRVINIMRATGRSEAALDLVEEKRDYTRRAGLGPWTQLADEARRLQLLNDLGRYEEVLADAETLRARMDDLPESGPAEEVANPWNVREGILDVGRAAALRLERWEDALALNAEIVAVTQARSAPVLEVTRTRYNDYGPLLRLKRYTEARQLLLECRAVFEAEGASPTELGAVFSALADLEDDLGHPDQAAAHERTALRYRYLAGDPVDCAGSHFNLVLRPGSLASHVGNWTWPYGRPR